MRYPRRFHVESLEGRVVLSFTAPPALDSAPALVASQAPTQSSTGLDTQTLNNLKSAMEGEALAYASYHAYADAARNSGQNALASVWDTIADVEFEDHFTLEAQLSGLVQDNVSNLNTVIAAEAAAITTYTQDAQQAFGAGYANVGNTFMEIAQDEAAHHALFNEALSALENKGVVPSGPTVEPTAIVPSEPAARGQTLTNIENASKDEAFAWAEYTLFARQAANTGQPQLAVLFTDIAAVELKDHFAKEANLSGLVGSNVDNLNASIADEAGAVTMYNQFADQADQVGDHAVAEAFREIAKDEAGHETSFQAMLASLVGPPAQTASSGADVSQAAEA